MHVSTNTLTPTSSRSTCTVLIFDSGIGGLSIYKEIKNILPELHYIYAFDNDAFPYGEKNKNFILNRVLKIINDIHTRHSLALAVIACNTASIISLPELRKKFHFPIVGVVPAIKSAVHLTKNKIVGLLATRGTIRHPYTQRIIKRFSHKCKIKTLGSPELVKFAEAKLYGEKTSLKYLREILYPWLLEKEVPDTVILGCTHFSLLRNELFSVFSDRIIHLVDSNVTIAHYVAFLLKNISKSKGFMKENIAYCTALTQKEKQLLPILYQHGIKLLRNELPFS